MSRQNIIAGGVSLAVHAGLLAALVLAAVPRPSNSGHGDALRTVQVFTVPLEGVSPERPSSSAQAPAAEAEPLPVEAGRGDQASLTRQPVAEVVPASEGGASGPMTASYSATALYSEYRQLLMTHLRPYHVYPAALRANGARGVVVIGFLLERGGGVREAWVETSSGSPALDAAALETVERAQPYPAIPGNLPGSLTMTIPLNYTPPRVLAATP